MKRYTCILNQSILLLFCLFIVNNIQAQYSNYLYDNEESVPDGSLVPIQRNNLYGYVDRGNNIAIEPEYESASFFNKEGYATVSKEGLYGVIDTKGKVVIPLLSRDLEVKRKNKALCNYSTNNRKSYLRHMFFVRNKNRNEILLFKEGEYGIKSSDIFKINKSPFHERIDYETFNESFTGYFQGLSRQIDKQGLVCFIDTNFNKVFKEGFYDAQQLERDRFCIYEENGKASLINEDSKKLCSGFYSINLAHTDGLYIASANKKVNSGRPMGLLDKSGELLMDTIYNSIIYLYGDRFCVSSKNKKGVLNKYGEEVIPFEYSRIQNYGNGFIAAQKSDKWYILDPEGNISAGPYSRKFQSHKRVPGFGAIFNNDTTTFLGNQGEKLFIKNGNHTIYDQIDDFLIVKEGKRKGIYSFAGNTVLELIYTTIQPTDIENIVIVQKDGEYAIYDLKGEWLVPFGRYVIQYHSQNISNASSSISMVNQEEKIVYKGSIENPEITKFENYTPKNLPKSKKNPKDGSRIATFPNGIQVTYPDGQGWYPKIFGEQVYFVKGKRRNKRLYDKDFKPLFEEGYYFENSIELGGKIVFIVENPQKFRGLVDLNGKWIVPIKRRQRFERIGNELLIVTNLDNAFILNKTFNKIRNKDYTSAKRYGDFIFCTSKGNSYVTIYNSKGKLITENTYTKLHRIDSSYITVEKSTGQEIQTCLLDLEGNEIDCLPYADVFAYKDLDYYIIKDGEYHGVIKKDRSPYIDVKYQQIKYTSELRAFALIKNNSLFTLIDINKEVIFEDFPTYFKVIEIKGIGFQLGNKNTKKVVFDMQGKLIAEIPKMQGYLTSNPELFKEGLFMISKGPTFIDVKTGMVYQ